MTTDGGDRPRRRRRPAAAADRGQRHQRHRRVRAQGHAGRPVLAVVRVEHLGARGVLRRVRARLRHRAVAGAGRRRGRRGRRRSSWSAWSRSPASAARRRRWCSRVRRSAGDGNSLPGLVSYVLLVGWETVLVALSTLATATVFERLGWAHGDGTKVVAFVVVAAVIVLAGVLGFDAIMRLQKWLTHRADRRHRPSTSRSPSTTSTSTRRAPSRTAPPARSIGAAVLVLTGFGLGWVNTGRRLLPLPAARRVAPAGVVWWPTFGGSLPVVILVGVRRPALRRLAPEAERRRSAADPIGALTTILPTWFLLPFALVAVRRAGQRRGDGHLLLRPDPAHPRAEDPALGGRRHRRRPDDHRRHLHRLVSASTTSSTIFEAFLIVLGVPMAAWCGVFLADLLRAPHATTTSRRCTPPAGVYGRVPAGRAVPRGRRHRRRLGAGHRHHRPARAWPGSATCWTA